MSKEMQMIYLYSVQLHWKVASGKSYTNHYKGNKNRPYQFVSRAKSIDDINRNPEIIFQLMSQNGLKGKKVHSFYIRECYEQKPLGESFHYKEEDYTNEYKN